MTQRQFWTGAALLYAIGFAVALFLVSTAQKMPEDAVAALALLCVPLVWGFGPIALVLIWLALKRDLSAARSAFLSSRCSICHVALNLWWRDLI